MSERSGAALACLLLLAGPAWAQEIKLPAEVRGPSGQFLAVRAETAGKLVRWRAVDPGLSLFPPDLLRDSRTAVVLAVRPGRYRLLAWTCTDSGPTEAAETLLVIGDPPDPGPGPGPGPKPPPDDPLYKSLADAWALESAPKKGDHRAGLAALYKQAGAALPAEPKTVGEMFQVLKKASLALLPPEALPGVRAVLAAELDRILPTQASAPLDAPTRTRMASTFTRVGKLLEALP